MFGSDILEVAIGIVFVFVLISTVCSAIREGIEGWLKTRASFLEHGILELLDDQHGTGIARDLFAHPQIAGLYSGDYVPRTPSGRPTLFRKGRNFPSYIPSRNFALAMLDLAARGPMTGSSGPGTPAGFMSLAQMRESVAKIENEAVRRTLLAAIDNSQGDLDKVRAHLESWYDSAMERVGGWYKRSTQQILFGIALVLVVGLNINTLTIADYLYRHGTVRSAIASQVESVQISNDNPSSAWAQKQLDEMHLPIGWSHGWGSPTSDAESARLHPPGTGIRVPYLQAEIFPWDDVVQPILGWLITIFAAMLGAPFWFDVLNKISALRSTVKPDTRSAPEGSPQGPPQVPAQAQPMTVQQVAPAPASDADSCAVGSNAPTPDDQLPAAKGGVAA